MNNNYNLVFGIPWSSCLHDPTGPGSPGRNPVSVVNSLIYEVMEAYTTALMTTSTTLLTLPNLDRPPLLLPSRV